MYDMVGESRDPRQTLPMILYISYLYIYATMGIRGKICRYRNEDAMVTWVLIKMSKDSLEEVSEYGFKEQKAL